MTQKITVGPVGADFATLSGAIASLPPVFVEPVTIEVHADVTPEAIVVPNTIAPSAANPLIIFALRATFPPNPLSPVQSVSGSLAQYGPPDPKLTRPKMLSLDIRSNHTQVNGFLVLGDVILTASTGVVVHGNIIEVGQIKVSRGVLTPTTNRISSNEVRMGEKQAGILVNLVDGVKVYHNTVLQRRFDAANLTNPSYGIEILESNVDVRNNIFAGQGGSAFAIRFIGNPAGSTFDSNFFAAFDTAKRFSYGLNPVSVTETSDQNQWAMFTGSSIGVLVGDPEFRNRTSPDAVDLDVSNTSPVMAAAPALPDVRTDVRSDRRPVDFVTMGAHEHAEVITESGRKRFLELLGGLSTEPITKCVLGDSGSAKFTLFEDFPVQLTTATEVDPIFQPVDIAEAVAPGDPGKEGEVIFHPYFQVSLPEYIELIGGKKKAEFERANEVGLLAPDNTLFMVKRMKSIPFDATGFLHTAFSIPVEIVA